MNLCYRVGCYLFHICILCQIKHFEFCLRKKHRLFRLIIFLYDLKLCFEFVIQENSPYLWGIWFVLRYNHLKIIHRIKIVKRSRFFYNVCSVWKRNRTSISLLIRKHLCLSICSDHDWSGRSKIIASISIYLKRTL